MGGAKEKVPHQKRNKVSPPKPWGKERYRTKSVWNTKKNTKKKQNEKGKTRATRGGHRATKKKAASTKKSFTWLGKAIDKATRPKTAETESAKNCLQMNEGGERPQRSQPLLGA